MAKEPKRGQTVQHGKSGKVGVVQSVVRGIIHVIFRDGTSVKSHASSFHKPKRSWWW